MTQPSVVVCPCVQELYYRTAVNQQLEIVSQSTEWIFVPRIMPSTAEEAAQRRPRRRKVSKTSEKENARASSSTTLDDTADITSKSRSRKHYHKKDVALQENDDNIAIHDSSNEDAALTRFQESVAMTSSASYWKRHSSLAECVMRASQSLHQKTTSSLLLEEHAPDLLTTCRTLVKDATETKSSTEKLEILYVAIHGLRALCQILTDTKKVDATMRILYHAVTTASDVCTKSKDLPVCADATLQCLGAFQALGSLLNGYKVQVEDSDTIVTFKWKTTRTSADLFPLPSLSASSKASGGSMTVKQVYKIAMQATLSVANALAHMYTIQIRKNGKVSSISDFGSYTCDILQQTTQPSYKVILRMAQEVIIPWTCFFSSSTLATKENIEDSLTYAKRIFRLLFDMASQIDKCVSQSSSRKDTLSPSDSLRLRKHAILAHLLSSKEVKLSRKAQTTVKEHHWEAACTYACKASVAYRQHLSKDKCVAHDDYLDHFHKEVGRVLDAFAAEYSLSYVEYCAYRALHSSCKVAEHGACESRDCVFGRLGLRFHHQECFSAETLDDSSEAAGQATLAVFFLVLMMHDELEAIISGKQSHDQDWTVKFEDVRDDIIATFRSVFVDASRFPPQDVMRRCFKLLELHGLNRKAYQILSRPARDCSSRATLIALETTGRVLAECIGPLAASLARSGEDKKQQQWEVAVDSFSRGLAVFDRVREESLGMEEPVCVNISFRTDDALRGLYALCHDCELASQLSEETLEKAAKVSHCELFVSDLNHLASFSKMLSFRDRRYFPLGEYGVTKR